MSRTDAHRPYRVVIASEPTLRTEQHNHAHSDCTLPDPHHEPGAWHDCHWELTPAAPPTCGCPLCTQQAFRKSATKAARVHERHLLTAARRGGEAHQLEQLEARTLDRVNRW